MGKEERRGAPQYGKEAEILTPAHRRSKRRHRGLFPGGASEVLVNDSHGSGYTIDYEILDKRAKIYHGFQRPGIMSALDGTFNAALMIGAHAMAGTKGAVLYHTMSPDVRQIRINGKPIGEIGIFALAAGTFGIPLVMLSGDTAACLEAEKTIPGIVTAEVKKGLSRYSAVCLSKEKARELVLKNTIQALKKIKKIKPFVLKGPFTFQTDIFKGKEEDFIVSSPEKLPKRWKKEPLIKAKTAAELLQKAWGREV